MFCPHINAECRPDCIKWVSNENKCLETIMAEYYLRASKTAESYEYMLQLYHLTWRLEMKRLLDDPLVSDDVKDAIKEAKDTFTVEKLLRDAGLLY